MAYIKKEDAIKAMRKAQQDRTWSMSDADVIEQMEEYIEALPIANVVEVVRCKDCKFRGTDDCSNSYYLECEGAYVDPMEDDDFCSYGERRDT